tara:strand:- start:1809 stop:2414 length:606 start_codon:yes stop_codon:yes gene_type:complete
VHVSSCTLENTGLLVVPGVGSFPSFVDKLQTNGFVESIRRRFEGGDPLLGICVGMQVFFEFGYEFKRAEGLGLVPGEVCQIGAQVTATNKQSELYEESSNVGDKNFKLPAMGWSAIQPNNDLADWIGTPLRSINPGTYFYFAHSMQCYCSRKSDQIATVTYNADYDICATVQVDNFTGVQFHPEKSSQDGLIILKDFFESQ